jgi:hypothetical protein
MILPRISCTLPKPESPLDVLAEELLLLLLVPDEAFQPLQISNLNVV